MRNLFRNVAQEGPENEKELCVAHRGRLQDELARLEREMATAKGRRAEIAARIEQSEERIVLGEGDRAALERLRKEFSEAQRQIAELTEQASAARRLAVKAEASLTSLNAKVEAAARGSLAMRGLEMAAGFVASWVRMAAEADQLTNLQEEAFRLYPRGPKSEVPDIFLSPWLIPTGAFLGNFQRLRAAAGELISRCDTDGVPDLVDDVVRAYVRSFDEAERDRAEADRITRLRTEASTVAPYKAWLRGTLDPSVMTFIDERKGGGEYTV